MKDALDASGHATEVMAQIAGQQYEAPKSEALGRQADRLVRELVSISAAFAVNGVTDLETHVAAAWALGATRGQILAAMKIASAIKGQAVRGIEEATARTIGVVPAGSEEDVSERTVRKALRGCAGSGDCGPQCKSGSQVDNQKN